VSAPVPEPESPIDAIVDRVPVLALEQNPDLEDTIVRRFVQDMAQDIHGHDTVARRYGLGDLVGLARYLRANPAVVAQIKKHKAICQSDGGVEAMVRLRALHTINESLAHTGALITDPRVPVGQQLEALKAHARMAGVDSAPVAAKDGLGHTPGATFAVNFHFSGGRVERLSTTVVDAVPELPAIGSEDAS
jgi:hypothetical protein